VLAFSLSNRKGSHSEVWPTNARTTPHANHPYMSTTNITAAANKQAEARQAHPGTSYREPLQLSCGALGSLSERAYNPRPELEGRHALTLDSLCLPAARRPSSCNCHLLWQTYQP